MAIDAVWEGEDGEDGEDGEEGGGVGGARAGEVTTSTSSNQNNDPHHHANGASANGANLTYRVRMRRVGGKKDGEETVVVAKHVVVAAGAWSDVVGRMLGVDIPIVPVKGQVRQRDRETEYAGCRYPHSTCEGAGETERQRDRVCWVSISP